MTFNNYRAEQGLNDTCDAASVGDQFGAFVAMLAGQHASMNREAMTDLIEVNLHLAETHAHEFVKRLKQLPSNNIVDFAEEAHRRFEDG